jgi:hypothetical protein
MSRRVVVRAAVLVGLTALALWWSLPHWQGHGGDHAYYAAMALQYSGVEYDESLRQVADYFNYPRWERGLDYGFLNPTVAPLIYSRPLHPLLAVLPVKLFGVAGVYVPGVLAGLVTVGAVLLTCRRRGTAFAGCLVVILLLASKLFTEVGFGIYVDSLVMAGVASMMLFLPWRGPTTWWHVAATCGVVTLMLLSRQVPLVTIGMVAGGWLWALVATRRVRNEWFGHAAGVLVTTIVVYFSVSRWAPYDPLPFLRLHSGTETRGELLAAVPGLVGEGLKNAASTVVADDQVLLLFVLLFLIGLWSGRRTPLAGAALGVLGACLVTLALNNLGYLRYLTPLLPVAAVLAADAVQLIGRRIPRWSLAGPEDEHASRPIGARPAALGIGLSVAVVLVGTVLVSRPAPLRDAPERTVRATKGEPWPLTVRRGTLQCAGDDLQIWFVTPQGTRYALSGTAMASSFRTPRITELARAEVAYGWAEIAPLLGKGVKLCRRTQQDTSR